MKARRSAVLVVAIVLAACGSDGDSGAEAGTPTPVTSTEPAVVSPAEVVITPDPSAALPTSRTDMESWEMILAEDAFLDTVRADPPENLDGFQDSALLEAGHHACDAMDRGSETRRVLAEAVIADMTVPDTAAVIAGVAAGTICPEHSDYLD
jgi:hypothetical protein